jgi:hypothetical protein
LEFIMVAQFPILKSARSAEVVAPKFRLSDCEFSLVQTEDGKILGRLFSPIAIPVSANTVRKIVDVRYQGRVILFESTYADYRHLSEFCQKSNIAATVLKTAQLLRKLAQRQWAAAQAQPAPAPKKDAWDLPALSSPLACPVEFPIAPTLLLPPAREIAESICVEPVNPAAWNRKDLVAIAKTLGISHSPRATKAELISLLCA